MSRQKYKIIALFAVIVFGLLIVLTKQALAQAFDDVPSVGPGCEVDLSTGGCRESTVVSPPTEPVIYGIEDEETNANMNNDSAPVEPNEPVVGSGGIIPNNPPEVQKPKQLKKPVKLPQKKTSDNTELSDSEALLDAVMATYNKQHKNEVAAIKQYYNKPPLFKPATPAQYVESDLKKLRPIGVNVVNAKDDYYDAMNKNAGQSEIAKLKNSYDAKLQDFKTQLQDILAIDSGNPDALWQMGTLSKWEGNNAQSYENYRDALMSQKSRNPFKYQQLLDSVNNPAIRMKLMQDMQPNENIIEIPTVKTSPFLAELKNNLDTLVQPLTTAKKTVAKNIEKISRAFSFSEQFDKTIKTLGVTQ